MMKYYKVFGLCFGSEILLPQLPVCQKPLLDQVDAFIRLGPVSKEGLLKPHAKGKFCQIKPKALWLQVPGVARFLIKDGKKIIVEPFEACDQKSLELYTLGSCLGALLHQREFFLLHANAICIKGHGFAFAGPSGIGKSTLAAAFHKRGYSLLTDDICVINHKGEILPGIPQIKLWQDSADFLNIPTHKLSTLRPQISKYGLPIPKSFSQTPVPLRGIYLLATSESDLIKIEFLKKMEKLIPLKENIYRHQYLEGLGLSEKSFAQCCQLINQISIKKLVRPQGSFQLEPLIDFILKKELHSI